ncbi:MAG: PilN domain-containing protein [Gammaproteobacteria bacterium]|nr:PilN domain-containing protein [Gammaproteobacteria bacterium]
MFNLLPWRVWRRRQVYREIAVIILVPLTVSIAGIAYCYHSISLELNDSLTRQQQLLSRIAAISLNDHKLAKQEQALQITKEHEARFYANRQHQQALFSSLIYLGSVMPSGMNISRWQFSDGKIHFSGQALGPEKITLFTEILKAIPVLSAVQIQNIQSPTDSTLQNFTIEARLNEATGAN